MSIHMSISLLLLMLAARAHGTSAARFGGGKVARSLRSRARGRVIRSRAPGDVRSFLLARGLGGLTHFHRSHKVSKGFVMVQKMPLQ